MEGVIVIIILVVAAIVFGLKKSNRNDLVERMVYNGKRYIHESFPELSGKQRFKTYVAGSNHYGQKYPPAVDNCLLLARDPHNSHDKDAIKVMTLLDEQVGFIPAHYAEELGPGIDRGRQFYAMVDKIENKEKGAHYIISVHEIAKVDQTI